MSYDDREADATLLAGSDIAASHDEPVTHSLSFTVAGGGLHRVTIGPQQMVIGRSRPADLVIESSKISRQHCALQAVSGSLVVTDLGSTNGTFVDGHRITASTSLAHGASLTVGGQALTYERLTGRGLSASQASERDLQNASAYVQMLLPKPLKSQSVQADWLFMPCARLGGSGFGYRFLSPTLFCGFLVEVAGQGTQTAMHAVAVMNLMRQPTISGVDLTQPDQVLAGLARSFVAEQNGGLFFSACYFTYDLEAATLRYAAAGRSPAYVADPTHGIATVLTATGGPIGLRVDEPAAVATCRVAPGMRLVLASDEVCDRLRLGATDHMYALAIAPSEPNIPEPLRVHQAVRHLAGESVFDEDFVALVFTF